jgi:hypothetical protein
VHATITACSLEGAPCPAHPPVTWTSACAQGRPLLWLAQQAFNPLQRLLADNCHLNRDPLAAIQAVVGGGAAAESDVLRFQVEGASLISPHVAGIVWRREA